MNISLSRLCSLVSASVYRDVSSKNGLVALKLGTAQIKIGYNRMIHKVDLEEVRKNVDYIQNVADSLAVTDHLRDTFNYKLKRVHDKIKSFLPKRQKRGLINGLGKVIKLIAGNPDQDDLDLINQNLQTIENSENNLIYNQNKQIKINSGLQTTINKVAETARKIKLEMSNNIQHLNEEIEYMNLILNLDILIKLLENLEEQISFAKSNIVNKNLLTLSEKHYIWENLVKQNVQINYEDEIFEFINCILTVKNNSILIIIKIPIVDTKEYELLQLETIHINETRIDTAVRFITKHRNTIYEQTARCTLCENTRLLADECIYNIMTNAKAKCPMIRSQKQLAVKEINTGIVLIDTNIGVEVQDSCDHSRIISTPTIVETGNCTIRILNYTFTNTAETLNQPDYITPVFGNQVTAREYKPTIEEAHRLNLDNTKELSKIKLHLSNHNMIGGILIASLLIINITIIYLYRRFYKQKHKITKQRQANKIRVQSQDDDSQTSQFRLRDTTELSTIPQIKLTLTRNKKLNEDA